MCLPIKVGFLLLDVHRVEGVESEPSGEGEPSLVRPTGQRGHHHRAPSLAGEREEHVGARSDERTETKLDSLTDNGAKQKVVQP